MGEYVEGFVSKSERKCQWNGISGTSWQVPRHDPLGYVIAAGSVEQDKSTDPHSPCEGRPEQGERRILLRASAWVCGFMQRSNDRAS